MNLFSPRVPQHGDELFRCGAADQRIIHNYNALFIDYPADNVEFLFDIKIPDFLFRPDERPAYIMIADKSDIIPDLGFLRESQCRRIGTVRNRYYDIRFDGVFPG